MGKGRCVKGILSPILKLSAISFQPSALLYTLISQLATISSELRVGNENWSYRRRGGRTFQLLLKVFRLILKVKNSPLHKSVTLYIYFEMIQQSIPATACTIDGEATNQLK